MATHSSILAWKNPMDKGAWRATVLGLQRAGRDLAPEQPQPALYAAQAPASRHSCAGAQWQLHKTEATAVFTPLFSFRILGSIIIHLCMMK